MKIYLDNCCIQRPLDDRTQLRIAVEGEIILNILSLIEAGQIRLLSSEISLYEAEKISNTFRREFTLKVLDERSEFTPLKDIQRVRNQTDRCPSSCIGRSAES